MRGLQALFAQQDDACSCAAVVCVCVFVHACMRAFDRILPVRSFVRSVNWLRLTSGTFVLKQNVRMHPLCTDICSHNQ